MTQPEQPSAPGTVPSTASSFYVGDAANPEKYRLVRQVGSDGEVPVWIGIVLVGGDDKVALRILRPDSAEDFERLWERLAEQVETLHFISDPGIVAVREFFAGTIINRQGEASPSQERALYLATNWVEGRSFRDWYAVNAGQAAVTEGLGILAQTARALDLLHARSVTHGNISPDNVIITPEGQAVLVDVGLAQLAVHRKAPAVGTPGFTAPEVWTKGQRGPAADRYGFAALGYFMLLGEAPPNDQASIYRALFSHPSLRDKPVSDAQAILRGFDPHPDNRPTAVEWLTAFRLEPTSSSRDSVALGPAHSPPPSPPPLKTTGLSRTTGQKPTSEKESDDLLPPLSAAYRGLVDEVASEVDLDAGSAIAVAESRYLAFIRALADELDLDAGVSRILLGDRLDRDP